jgi:hypothetical protein
MGRNKSNILANTNTKIHIRIVFLFRSGNPKFYITGKMNYITGIIQNNKHKLLLITSLSLLIITYLTALIKSINIAFLPILVPNGTM